MRRWEGEGKKNGGAERKAFVLNEGGEDGSRVEFGRGILQPPRNEARTGKIDVLYPVLERRLLPIEGGGREEDEKSGRKARDALLVSGMDYGIGWNSGPESPPCLFQRNTSSFRHVRRGILPRSYTVFRFFPGAVYGDLSHCLRFRVSHAPTRPRIPWEFVFACDLLPISSIRKSILVRIRSNIVRLSKIEAE